MSFMGTYSIKVDLVISVALTIELQDVDNEIEQVRQLLVDVIGITWSTESNEELDDMNI